MASKKRQQGRAATAAAPATAATARPALPEGFERITDDDGDELVQPTPKQAVADLLEVLLSVPPWRRFSDDPDKWTPSQIRERGRPRPGHVIVAGVGKDGEAFEIELRDDRRVMRVTMKPRTKKEADPFHDEVLGEGTAEKLVSEWERRTGRKRTRTEPKILRSPIDKRRQLHAGFDVFVPQAIKAVLAAGGSAAPLEELERDEELHADTVAAAVAELRKLAAPPVAEVDAPASKPTAKTPIDVERDAVCVSIRGALAKEPNGLLYGTLRERAKASEGTVKSRLRLLKAERHVVQTGNRGAYRLTVKGAEQQRRD